MEASKKQELSAVSYPPSQGTRGWPSLSALVSRPVPELWVPRPCVFCKGGRRCCLYYLVCYAQRTAPYIRRSSSALYHLLVLPAIAFPRFRSLSRPLPLDSGTDAPALPFRGGGVCRDAGAHSPALHGTGDRNSLDCDAGAEAACGQCTATPAQAEEPAPA